MKKLGLGLLTAAFLLSGGTAWATNGHQLAAVGAYGAGMGGAVTAAPFDSTTAVTNPAGLTKLGPRADFNFGLFMPKRSVDFTGTGGAQTNGGSEQYLLPAVGWSAPINDEQTLFFGGGMFLVSGMGVDYDTINVMPFQAALGNPSVFKGRIYSQYQLWKMAPSLAKKFTDQFSVGLALNIDYQQMSLKQWFYDPASYNAATGNYDRQFGVDLSSPEGAMGFGFTVGALYDVNEMVSIGLNYVSQQNFSKMKYRLKAKDVTYSPDNATMYISKDGTFNLGMDFPQQYAVGVAVRPTSNFLVTLDYKVINFSSTMKNLSLEGDFNTASATTGAPIGTAASMPLNMGWKDVTVIALGVQYQIDDKGFIRAGYNSGTSPIESSNASQNWAFPAIAKSHMMLGGTANIGKHWQLNLAYESLQKETLTGAYGDKISLEGSSFILGVTYLFL